MRDALVVSGIELAASHTPACDGFALPGDEPEQNPTCDLLLLVAE
jgi:hypothetical protein